VIEKLSDSGEAEGDPNDITYFTLGNTYFLIGDKSSALNEYEILKKLNIHLAGQLFDLINNYRIGLKQKKEKENVKTESYRNCLYH